MQNRTITHAEECATCQEPRQGDDRWRGGPRGRGCAMPVLAHSPLKSFSYFQPCMEIISDSLLLRPRNRRVDRWWERWVYASASASAYVTFTCDSVTGDFLLTEE